MAFEEHSPRRGPPRGALAHPRHSGLSRTLYALDPDDASPVQAVSALISTPILLVHGSADSIIPIEHARRLQAAGGANVKLWILDGYAHTQGVRLAPDCHMPSPIRDRYLQRTVRFFEQHL